MRKVSFRMDEGLWERVGVARGDVSLQRWLERAVEARLGGGLPPASVAAVVASSAEAPTNVDVVERTGVGSMGEGAGSGGEPPRAKGRVAGRGDGFVRPENLKPWA